MHRPALPFGSEPILALSEAWEASPFGLFVCDEEGRFLAVNAAYERLSGYSREDLLAGMRHTELLDAVEARRRNAELTLLHRAGASLGKHRHDASWHYRRPDGERLAVRLALAPMPGWQALAGAVIDLQAGLPQNYAQLWYASHHDARTRLPNLAWALERLELRIQRARLNEDTFSVIVVEADNLERLRSSLGSTVLERVLQVMAARLRSALRAGESLACLDGTRFLVLTDASRPEIEGRVVQWLDMLAQPVAALDRSVRLGASAGLAPGDAATDADSLIRRAGLALDAARAGEPANWRWFERGMQAEAVDKLELEQLLREALHQDQFHLVFQPQVNLASGEIALMESLLRWRHPVRGLISSAEFIPVAERCGLIVALGAWVMDQACKEAARLLRKLGRVPVVTVNVSPPQIQNGLLVPMIQRCLAAHDLPPHCLEVEVTEGVMLGDTEAAMATLGGLRDMGVKVALDDFGTGYSSLAYLTRMPVDRLKVDRAFVQAMLEDDRSRAVVSAIIAMAHALGLRVTAEGVETQAQADALRALDCDEIQGYWFSRPLAVPALEAALVPL
ncbi:diguanylate cyclase/phosphodiesterase (GGDEF & EAL domains) with PAS/PAC sensor(s) [plant metagenome]|uniref:Diguanylate cyclase/phosphodiesterase (GGDEF & EAL domains) with PAS/PAC sensor(S) n=1 Tax=plant metagenome TaxID=1297885 RepID=A0A484VD61_9ZZZZ